MSIAREHIPLAVVTIVLVIALVVLYKDVKAVREQVTAVSGRVAAAAAQRSITEVASQEETYAEEEEYAEETETETYAAAAAEGADGPAADSPQEKSAGKGKKTKASL